MISFLRGIMISSFVVRKVRFESLFFRVILGASLLFLTFCAETKLEELNEPVLELENDVKNPPKNKKNNNSNNFDNLQQQRDLGDGDKPLSAGQTPDSSGEKDSRVTYQVGDNAVAKKKDYIAEVMEMAPVSIDLKGVVAVRDLPAGAIFDTEAKRIYWIPQKGQQGQHRIHLEYKNESVLGHLVGFAKNLFSLSQVPDSDTEGTATKEVIIKVHELSEASLLEFGPLDVYADDDVGYVFVHGKTLNNLCLASEKGAAYWDPPEEYGTKSYKKRGDTSFEAVIAPNDKLKTIVCYDGSVDVPTSAPDVARQIIDAPCGKYGKCIVVTHSMGGLQLEYIFTHARKAREGDEHPEYFVDSELFQSVKAKTVFVVSLASAAGGSKSADLIVFPEKQSVVQGKIGEIAKKYFNADSGATQSLAVERATKILAPVGEDPGVPFFMIPGYSETVQDSILDGLGAVFDQLSDDPDKELFNGDLGYPNLDSLVNFHSRSDGIVAFRSSCGSTSVGVDDGPGHTFPSLEEHLEYCFQVEKKPNHYVWFLSELNHSAIALSVDCGAEAFSCSILFPDIYKKTYVPSPIYQGSDAAHTIRELLTKGISKYNPENPVLFDGN